MSDELRRTYDAVADDYAAHIFDELKDKPFDRQLLDEVAASAAGGIVCDQIGRASCRERV